MVSDVKKKGVEQQFMILLSELLQIKNAKVDA